MARRWFARRLLISAFVAAHLGATFIWNLPPCPIKDRCFGTLSCYMIPLGLWQYWSMFCPDPVREADLMEAEVIDAQGLRHAFSFPHVVDFSTWRAVPRFRHAKYAYNLLNDEFAPAREAAARHVARRLNLPAESYPIGVQLYYQVYGSPEPGIPADSMTPPWPRVLAAYEFSRPSEVRR